MPLLVLGVAWLIALVTSLQTIPWLSRAGRPFPGFLVMETGVVPTVGLAHWTGKGVIPFHSRVLQADDVPIARHTDLYRYVATLPEGRPVTYLLEKDGDRFNATVPTMRFQVYDWAAIFGMYILIGTVGLASATVVSLLRPRLPAARALMLFGFLWGLFPLTGTALYFETPWWLCRLHYLTQAAFGASFIHLGWTFPVERAVVMRHRWLLVLPYAVGIVLTGWIWVAYYADPPSVVPLHAAYAYAGVSMPVFLGSLAYSYWENRTPMVRPRTLAILVGGIIGGSTAIYGFLDTAVQGGSFPINYITFLPIIFFLSIAYAIVAHDAFEITRVLRQTALYVLLTMGLVGIYYVGWGGLASLLPAEVVASPVFTVVFLGLAGFAFQPLRSIAQDLIDRTFYRTRLDYRRTVSRVSAALPSLLSLDQILERIGRTLYEGFPLDDVGALLWMNDPARCWRWNQRTEQMQECPPPPSSEALRERLDAVGQVLFLLDPDSGEPAEAPLRRVVDATRAAIAVPIVFGPGAQGALMLGHKRSGLPFDAEDVALLETLAAQAAVAIQNALSYERVEAAAATLEWRVHERTAELERRTLDLKEAYHQLAESEKMASLGQLVAGVAHELNNPVSFITGNLGPMRDRLAALRARLGDAVDPHAGRLVDQLDRSLDIVARGADRVAKIVRDLRTFSRGGEGVPEPMDLHEAIEFTLVLLKDRWDGRIAIRRRFGEVPLIEVVGSQINQVLLNLLSNACDAIPERGTITVATESNGERAVISVTDDGVGIAEDVRRRIFEPFVTTKPQGKGVGLGLSISRGIVEAHRGRITVTSSPGLGSTFRVELPIRAVMP